MDLGLRNRRAVVAASSQGLGYAAAYELAAEGARVVVCARGADALDDAREAIARDTGVEVQAVVADLATQDGIERLAREADHVLGGVDILVNNTGGPPSGPFEQHDWAAWQRAVDLLLRSAVELTRWALPGMRARKWGRIINVTSIAVKQPVDGLMLSNAVRAAVTGMARTLANEVARDGVTVNNIVPGYTRTERVLDLARESALRERLPEADVLARFEGQIPMKRLGEPREFGALVAFLASERASYITAQSLAVDGGWIRSLL